MKRTVTRYARLWPNGCIGNVKYEISEFVTVAMETKIVPVRCTYDDGRKPPRKRKTKKARKACVPALKDWTRADYDKMHRRYAGRKARKP